MKKIKKFELLILFTCCFEKISIPYVFVVNVINILCYLLKRMQNKTKITVVLRKTKHHD